MNDQVTYDEVAVRRRARCRSATRRRLNLVMYCGASGDFNVIHWNERVAKAVGLPDVIAHGMFTMAQAGPYVTDWAGPECYTWSSSESGSPRRSSSLMTTPGDAITVSGKVEEKLDGHQVALALTAH